MIMQYSTKLAVPELYGDVTSHEVTCTVHVLYGDVTSHEVTCTVHVLYGDLHSSCNITGNSADSRHTFLKGHTVSGYRHSVQSGVLPSY